MSLDCWDLDRTNYVSVNLLITVLTRTGASDDLRAASIQPLWERQILTEDNAALDELGHKGMLESHDANEAVLNVRTRVEDQGWVTFGSQVAHCLGGGAGPSGSQDRSKGN